MDSEKNTLTLWQSAAIITGYGIGGGVMAMPYLTEKNGIISAFLILTLALAASVILHLMIAELSVRSDDYQIISAFSRFLFRGRLKNILSVSFFAIMALVLVFNLSAYIEGAAEIIAPMTGLSFWLSRLIFYLAAASVVLFGLRAVGISEEIGITAILALILLLTVASLLNIRNPLPISTGTTNQALAYFGMSMFAFSAFFSVPQAVKGLKKDRKMIRKAVFLGIFVNYVLIILISISALLASAEVTQVAIVGWSMGIGIWAEVIGSLFTLLAMLTTYWSISLALSDIIKEQLKLDDRLCWLLATLPSLLFTMLSATSFFDIMRVAGGLIAIIIAVMVVPAYINAKKEGDDNILGRLNGTAVEVFIIIMYILMAVGNVVPV